MGRRGYFLNKLLSGGAAVAVERVPVHMCACMLFGCNFIMYVGLCIYYHSQGHHHGLPFYTCFHPTLLSL